MLKNLLWCQSVEGAYLVLPDIANLLKKNEDALIVSGGKGLTWDFCIRKHLGALSLSALKRYILCSRCFYSQCGWTRLVVAAEASSMFQMAPVGTGTDGEGAPRTTTTTWSRRRWPECLWLSLTMTPCPCLRILTLLMRSCRSRKARSSRLVDSLTEEELVVLLDA